MKKKKYKYIAVILAVAVGINCSMGIATNGVFIATAEENGVEEAEEKIECSVDKERDTAA